MEYSLELALEVGYVGGRGEKKTREKKTRRNRKSKNSMITELGSSLFPMGKVTFQINRVGFCEDIHTKQRSA
jgi:hypothetical protein